MPTVKAPPPSKSNTAQNGYHHQGLSRGPPHMHPPDYENGPRKATVPITNHFRPTPDFSDTKLCHNEPTHYPTSVPPSYDKFLDETTDVPDAAITLDSRPEADELLWLEKNNKNVRIIPRVAADWEQLALYLEIESYIIRIIKRDKSRCEDACVEMFQRWLDGEGKGPRTWKRVASALEKIEDRETADLIRQVLDDEA